MSRDDKPNVGRDAINLYQIYYDVLKNIVTRTHGSLQNLPGNLDQGILLDTVITHVENCPDCQRLLRYVTNKLQEILPVETTP
ncbi:MAG: hypothetical protein Q8R29_02495 [bacterium]|nr:hypothetical protein [bacterium]